MAIRYCLAPEIGGKLVKPSIKFAWTAALPREEQISFSMRLILAIIMRKVPNIDSLRQHNSVDLLKDILLQGQGVAGKAGVISGFLSCCLGNRHMFSSLLTKE
jgi:hypothetical protein